MNYNFRVLGMRIEHVLNKETCKNEKIYVLCLHNTNREEIAKYGNKFYELVINDNEPIIEVGINLVKNFNKGFNYRPNQIIEFNIRHSSGRSTLINTNEILLDTLNNVFNINMNCFNKLSRGFDKRPVWIITGDSNLGKTYLTSFIQDSNHLSVYETDSDVILPEVIRDNVVVVGNRNGSPSFTLEEVKERVANQEHTEFIRVHFTKEN